MLARSVADSDSEQSKISLADIMGRDDLWAYDVIQQMTVKRNGPLGVSRANCLVALMASHAREIDATSTLASTIWHSREFSIEDPCNALKSLPPRVRQSFFDVLAARSPKEAGNGAEYEGRTAELGEPCLHLSWPN
jgi:hypothetical protein